MALSPCNPRKWDVLKQFDSVENLYKNYKSNSLFITANERNSLYKTTIYKAEEVMNYCENNHINIYCYEDNAYPQKLREIKNPPTILFSYGRLENINFNRSVAIVGSRNADEYSTKCTRIISSQLAQNDVTIISGFAKGIDTAAHQGAIYSDKQTVAVLGCGLEYDYPKNTFGFKKEISKNGAVISEFMPNSPPAPENFKIRNRICSALSDAVLCTQASARSGALNTVAHALEQGKDIFVTPPHDIFSQNYQGIISILKDGAQQIYSAEDLLNKAYN